ncbi:putative nuclear migration protein [Talaromyces proteolyticus]|uniref:Nuclear migration protein n=1 Tax=Talaromyces proteolyticus TaxID=1131652 RepID=A0AAD4KWC6_9EURO|nr:putative nuclear migration protein [Talaromyces proteolyticus]KAH8702418.1 putative nuclear migration protein [Talaromyces proteolyticus]
MEDPFVSSPDGAPASREPHRYSSFDTQLFTLNASSPSQAKRALEAHLAETERRLQEASKLGTSLINQQKELSDKLKEVEQQRDDGEIGPELRQKLVDLEKEYNEIGRESARAFLAPKRAISGGDATPSVDLRSPAASAVFTSQASASPSKVSVPSRKQRNQPSGRVHDIEFATEISTSLLAQVRQLQSLLAEREEALKAANLETSRLELEAEGFTQRIRTLDESEQRYKDENWSLETQGRELMAAVKEAQDRETKLNSALSSLTAEKRGVERELEELKQNNGKLMEDQAAAQKAHDSETHMLRRNLTSGDAERLTLQAKVEELTNQNQELAKAVASMRSRHVEAETPRPFRPDAEDSEPERDTPDNSPPPSPNKQTPRHGHLETETLRSSLGHAHRMIQNLKSNIHREKTEKIELKRMLQEARDELETRRRDNAPGSGAKRQKIKPDTFKKPLPRSDLLGPGRRGRTEITLDEPDWEDHTSEASPTRTVRSKASQRMRSPRGNTDASDVYQTATEAEDAFETANERETATESEAFQTGVESMAEDSNEELTETEDRGTPRQGTLRGRRVPSQLALAKAGNRSSFMSTASTSDDEISEIHTPVQAQSQRQRVKANRPGYRRIRPSGEAPMASSIHETSSAQDSPVGSFQHESAIPMGQSLFAELEELGSPGSDGEFGTPIRSTHMLSQPSTPLQNSVILDRDSSQVPLSKRQSQMVDSSTMTEPWAPEVAVAAEQAPTRDVVLEKSLLPSVDSSTQYTPTKLQTGLSPDHLATVPTPPKTIWDESIGIGKKDIKEFQSPVKFQLDVSTIKAEETAPVNPKVRELSLSTIFSQQTEPIAAKPREPEVALIPEKTRESEVVQLSISSIYSEQTEPVSFQLALPEPIVIEQKPSLDTSPKPEVAFSSIYSVKTDPLPIKKQTSSTSLPLSISPIQSTETLPIEPVILGVTSAAFVDDSLNRPVSAVRRTEHNLSPHKKPSTVFISEDATSETSLREGVENQPNVPNLPLNDISGNSSSREVKKITVQNADQAAQTILSSKQIDQLLLDRVAGRPFTPSESRSASGLDSTFNSPGATPKAKAPVVDINSTPVSQLRRPSSSGSVRIGSSGSNHPPLPADHRQVIAAAQTTQNMPGTMGPPLAPASAYKTSVRPRTPNENSTQPASVRARTRRASQTSTARSSLSSFVSEIDVRFNMQAGELPQGIRPGTDPRMIQAITQTMIGEYLWKYTRRTVTGDMSNTRHRRYFWVHPYTRTLYWSDQDPSHTGKNESRAKSVAIEAVRVITDDNPYPPGLHRKSLEVLTPGRRIRFTAPTSQRHETWYNALSYLLLRTDDERPEDQEMTAEDVEEFNPGIRSHSRQTGPRMSVSSYHSLKTNTSKQRATSSLSIRPPVTPGRVSPAPSSQQNSALRQSTSSRISSVFNATIRGSFASIRGRHTPVPLDDHDTYNAEHDSAEDLRQVIERQEREADRLENVRACCDGKFGSYNVIRLEDSILISYLRETRCRIIVEDQSL